MNINTVVVTGNLTRDPESVADGKVASFGIAVNSREKKNDEWQDRADFFDVTCFGKTAENVLKYLKKGASVAIDGRLRQDRWKTDSGDNRSKVKVIAQMVQFLGPKDSDGPSDAGPPASGGDEEIPF